MDAVGIPVGTRVRLRPRAGGDVFDLVLAGKAATVESIQEVEGGDVRFDLLGGRGAEEDGRDVGMLQGEGDRAHQNRTLRAIWPIRGPSQFHGSSVSS